MWGEMRLLPVIVLLLLSPTLVLKAQAEEKRIGVVLPLTGPMAQVGKMLQNSLTIVAEQRDPGKEFRFIVEDDAFNPRHTLSAARKLLDDDKVSGLVVFGSGGALAVAGLADDADIPMMAIAYSAKVTEGRRNVFRLAITLEDSVVALCAEARRRKYERVALVGSAQEAMTSLRVQLASTCQLNLVFNDEVVMGDVDLRSVVSRIKQSKPDAVGIFSIPPQGAILSRDLRGQGFKGDIFSGISGTHRSEIDASQGGLLGAWIVAGETAHAKEFLEMYRERFGTLESFEGFSMHDAVSILIKGLRGAGAATIRELTEFRGIGGVLSIDSQHTFREPVTTYRITPDWFERVE